MLERVTISENKEALRFIKNFYRIEKILYICNALKKIFSLFSNKRVINKFLYKVINYLKI